MLKVHRAKKGVVSVSIREYKIFTVVISTLNSNHRRVWNSLELYAKDISDFDSLMIYLKNIASKS